MKNLFSVLALLTMVSSYSFAYDKTIEDQNSLFAQTDYSNMITRYNSISLFLDDLYFKVKDSTSDYYISLKTQYYSWPDGEPKPDKPKYEYGTLYKQTITSKNGVASLSSLSDVRVTPNVTLKNINLIGVEVKIVKENKKESKLTTVLNSMINQQIADAVGLNLVNLLIDQQAETPTDIIVYKSDFVIPLNSVEYSTLATEGNNKLLKNNVPIGITISGKTASNVLGNSVMQKLLFIVSQVFTSVADTPSISTKDVTYDGAVRIRFSSSINSLIPQNLQTTIRGISDASLSSDYTKAIDWIARSKDIVSAYSITDDQNQELFFTTNMFCKIGELYVATKKDFDSIINKTTNVSKKWKDEIDTFNDIMSFNAKKNKFKIYGVKGIDPTKEMPIYIPYALDERALTDFVMWQIKVQKFMIINSLL